MHECVCMHICLTYVCMQSSQQVSAKNVKKIIFPKKTQFEEKKALFSDYIMHKKLICLP